MSASIATGAVGQATLSLLKAWPALTTLVPPERITDDSGSRPTVPYVLVESVNEAPFNTLGPDGKGSSVRFMVRAVSQYRGDAEVTQIASAIRDGLDGKPLMGTGYPGKPIATFENG